MEKHDGDGQGWWDIKRTGKYLDVSTAFLRKAVREKRVPFVRIGSKALRFRKEDLDRWLEASSTVRETAYRKD